MQQCVTPEITETAEWLPHFWIFHASWLALLEREHADSQQVIIMSRTYNPVQITWNYEKAFCKHA